MRVSISNLAWSREHDEAVAALLARHGVDAIDVAPSRYFADPGAVEAADAAAVRRWWQQRGVAIVGLQSLLFGTEGLNLFGPEPVRGRMLGHLSGVCRLGAALGARFLVFGSPRNRDRAGLDERETGALARSFLGRLGDAAGEAGVVVCLEPNPTAYGANFMTDAASTAAVVDDLDHPCVRMQLDVGALTMNGESADFVLAAFGDRMAHAHASEPGLAVLGTAGADHAAAAEAIRRHRPDLLVTVEMREPAGDPLPAVDAALALAVARYGDHAP